MAYSTFTLTGKHTTPTGKAHAGQVVVTPNTAVRDTDGNVILSGAEKVTLDASGAWSILLPCDGAGLNPSSGIGYRIGFALHSTSLAPLGLAATADLAGTTLDVSDILPGTTPTAPATVNPIAYDADGVPYLTI